MASAQFFAFVALLFCAYAQAQINVAQCPDVAPVDNFDFSKYVGEFFEIERIVSQFDPSGVCSLKYQLLSNGSLLVDMERTEEPYLVTGHLDHAGPGQVIVYLPNRAAPGLYSIISTDYNTTIAMRCDKTDSGAQLYLFVYAREKVLSEERLAEINSYIVSRGLPADQLVLTDRAQCKN